MSNFRKSTTTVRTLHQLYGKVSREFHNAAFKHEQLLVRQQDAQLRKQKPDSSKIKFGEEFTDHMLVVKWNHKTGWDQPQISPLKNLSLHPGCKALHYATELFEGLKAYRGVDGRIRLFRPELNMERMLSSAERCGLPKFDAEEFLKCLSVLLDLERDWVPSSKGSSLYIRPTMIGTDPTLGVTEPRSALLYVLLCPVSSYFRDNAEAVSLLASPDFVRACPGGVGSYKMGCNYAPTIKVGKLAQEEGCHQALWLYGEDNEVTEAGTMNIFALLRNDRNERELVTPSLDGGLILPGITRRSVLELCRENKALKVSERKLTLDELRVAARENKLLELFGSGTACMLCPIQKIVFKTENVREEIMIPTMRQRNPLFKSIRKTLTDIQYGKTLRPHWVRVVGEPEQQQRDAQITKKHQQTAMPVLPPISLPNALIRLKDRLTTP